jgi:acetyl esterase/lipase
MIVCPGGAFHTLAITHEGTDVAEWLSSTGIHAFVLKYRIGKYAKPHSAGIPLADYRRAIRTVRVLASERDYDPNRIGVMGFSAGGYLAIESAVKSADPKFRAGDRVDSTKGHPDFIALIYPAVPRSVDSAYSRVAPVPVFVVSTSDDFLAKESVEFLSAHHRACGPIEYHMFPKGGHGYGLADIGTSLSQWPLLFERWAEETLDPYLRLTTPGQREGADRVPHVKRINLGSFEPIRASDGTLWEPDCRYTKAGGTADRGPIAIKNTTIPEVYRTERYGNVWIRIPVENGAYTVRLHLCETWRGIRKAGQRVFGASIEDSLLLDGIDVFSRAGGKRHSAVVVERRARVLDGYMDVSMFGTGKGDPFINAIELRRVKGRNPKAEE